jgi:hypothetical protein
LFFSAELEHPARSENTVTIVRIIVAKRFIMKPTFVKFQNPLVRYHIITLLY